MSLYNMIHGEDPYATVYLSVLGLSRDEVPRYRDCRWDGSEISIYARVGGPNRPDYQTSPQGPSIDNLVAHPCYLRDEDSKTDNTYMTFFFSVPTEMAWVIPHMKATDVAPDEKWGIFLEKMNSVNADDDPQVQKALAAFEPLVAKIRAHFGK